jgi:hypothetical protein
MGGDMRARYMSGGAIVAINDRPLLVVLQVMAEVISFVTSAITRGGLSRLISESPIGVG